MFDRYYCIKTNCDTRKFGIFEENEPVNLYFLRLKARGNDTFTACVLKTPLPGQIPTSCWRRFYVCYRARYWRQFFMTALECIQLKQQSRWIALLKHGFVLVKTWPLIACGTGFYATIMFIACIQLEWCPMSKCGVQMLPVIWEGSREAIAHYVLGEIKNGGGFFYTHICTR